MEVILCTCNDDPPHTHVPKRVRVRNGEREFTIPEYWLNADRDYEILYEIPESIRVAVDWKAVARELMTDEQV